MTPKQLFLIMLAGLVLTLGAAAGGTYALAGLLTNQSEQLATKKAEVAVLTGQQTGLTKSKRDITRYKDLQAITQAIVPQDKDQAQTVRELTNIAAANRISLTTITFPSSNLGSQTGAVAATAAKPNLSQLTAVKNIPGVYNLQITIGNNSNNTVTFNQLDAFLRGLENNRRTAAVGSLTIQPQPDNPNRLVFTLVVNTYIKPS